MILIKYSGIFFFHFFSISAVTTTGPRARGLGWAPWPPRLLGWAMGALAPPVTGYHGRPGPPVTGYHGRPGPPRLLGTMGSLAPRLLGTMGSLAPRLLGTPFAPWPRGLQIRIYQYSAFFCKGLRKSGRFTVGRCGVF